MLRGIRRGNGQLSYNNKQQWTKAFYAEFSNFEEDKTNKNLSYAYIQFE